MNPRTPTGQNLKSCTVGQALLPSQLNRQYSGNIIKVLKCQRDMELTCSGVRGIRNDPYARILIPVHYSSARDFRNSKICGQCPARSMMSLQAERHLPDALYPAHSGLGASVFLRARGSALNWTDSVEPFMAVVEDWFPLTILDISSKYPVPTKV